MTWELAESGNNFITSVINGADLVPTFSAASVDDLRAEVSLYSFFLNKYLYPIIRDLLVVMLILIQQILAASNEINFL